MKTNRRRFLQAAAAAAPMLWLPRISRAATPGFGTTKHLLVLYAQGGFRSHCTFNAVGTPSVNPFGAAPVLAGRQWRLGAAAGNETFPVTMGAVTETVPSFASISGDVTVLGTIDHVPGGTADADHLSATQRITTGTPNGTTGLLSLIGRDHPLYANGFSLDAVPPVEVRPTPFGIGSGSYAATRPLSLLGAASGLQAGPPVGKGWKIAARAAQDERMRNHRPRTYRQRISGFVDAKRNAEIFADLLSSPKLDVVGAPDGAADGFTNAQLLQVLGGGENDNQPKWGPDVALGLRFLASGSPACAVTLDAFDFHDGEAQGYAPVVRDLVRQLAGLHWLLHRMPHPEGGTYWDKTLVAVVSEFSRNNTGPNGFNSGAGSDHVAGIGAGACRNQAIAMMGGPIAASKGKLIGETDDQIEATGQVFSSQSLLTTFVDALGVPQSYFGAEPIAEIYS